MQRIDTIQKTNHHLCIAPMMECTDRHFRYFVRLITRRAFLYTEMITTGALIHGDTERFLAHDTREYPLGLQLGGSDPDQMAKCAAMAQKAGYDEVNINAGCPSDRVQSGRFGACLMAEPQVVADCVAGMREACTLPITVKTRIGIDEQDIHQPLNDFIGQVSQAGCSTFIIHARKAWLKGLNPRQNREVPPLNYQRVYQLKRDFPHLQFIINGGITTIQESVAHNEHVEGVMIGREAYSNPYMLSEADELLFADDTHQPLTRHGIIEHYLPYVEKQLQAGVRLSAIIRHLMGLFNGMPGAKSWRRFLSEEGNKRGANASVISTAASLVSSEDHTAEKRLSQRFEATARSVQAGSL